MQFSGNDVGRRPPDRNQLARDLVAAIKANGRGSDEAKQAAIRLCDAKGIDPYTRYAVQQPLTPYVTVKAMATPLEISTVYEWQRMIGDVVSRLNARTR